MHESMPTVITVELNEFRDQLEQLLDQVASGAVQLTVERDGEPVVVIYPAESSERRRARQRFLERIEEAQQRANLSAEEAEQLAQEAVEAVRQ